MGKVLRYLNLLVLTACCGALFVSVSVRAEEGDEEILVGRIAYVEGKLLRYIEEEKDWVLTVKDSPFGLEDALYSGEDSKAEFIMPNGTWLRVAENTQVQLIALNPDATTIDLASGLSRLYNKSEDTLIKVTTPFGYVVAPGGAAFDLYVGDESLEVVAISGDVDFIHDGSKAKYLVREGSSSIIANEFETDRGNGAVDAEWDDWNAGRDKIWDDRLRRSEHSAQFLPAAIREESHVLEENGRWERVHYEGEYRDMWRPTRVESEWRPFTAGRWTVYYGDNCWIPDEDFGYVTHHYGSWVYVDSFRAWYWMPPVARFVVDTPSVSIRFGWFPGRVGWIHSGPSIGWVPLAPREVYYGSRRWGHRTVVVRPSSGINISINIGGYRYINDAVVVHRDHFYRGSRYTQVYERNISRDVIVNNYRPTTIINNTIINNINIDKRRYTFNDVEVIRKPHTTVINRINDNHRVSRGFDRISRQRIEGDLKRFQTRKEPSARVEVRRPRLVSKIVAVENIAKPIQSLALEEKELKPKRRERERPVRVDFAPRSELAVKDGGVRQTAREKADDKGGSKPSRELREEKPQLHGPQGNLRDPGEESRVRRERPLDKQQREEIQSPREQLPQAEKLPGRKSKEDGLQQERIGQEGVKPRLRSPRDKDEVQAERILSPQDRKRSPEENRSRSEQRLRRQPDEDQGIQNMESSGRQAGDLQGPREQRRLAGESQTRKPKAEGVRPVPVEGEPDETRSKPPREKTRQGAQVNIPPQDKGRRQGESQSRQEVDVRGEKQDGQQLRQKEEKQRLRQIEAQRQQEQEKQQRQEQEKQLRQEEDQQRQQQEGRQLKEREEKQRQRQMEAQRRQEQEKQQRQLQEKQVRREQERKPQDGPQVQQRQEKRRQQEPPAGPAEQQVQQERKKKKRQQEEEQLQGQEPTKK